MRVPRRPRFVQQLGLLGLLIAVPLLILAGTATYLYVCASYKIIETEAVGRARALAERLDDEFDKIMVTLQALGRVAEAGADLARLQRYAREIEPTSGFELSIDDLSGERASGAGSASAVLLMEDRGLEGHIAAIATNRARVTDLVVNPTADRSGWKITAPVTRGGVLSGAMDLVPPPGFINELLRPLALPPGWQWDIFDRRGAVIARSPYAEQQPDRRPAETEGVSWTTGTGAPAALQAVYRLKSIDWRVGVTVPAQLAEAPLRNACLLFGLGAAVLLLFACALSTRLAGQLVGEVRGLQEAAEGPRAGHFATREFQDLYGDKTREAARRVRQREQLDWMTLELQHRTNNLLAVVSSIARHTLLNGRSIADAREAFLGRLHALANASASLAQANWAGAQIFEVIEKEMSGFEGRYAASGPQVLLSPQAAQNVSLVIHELVTNAFRHGALSSPSGHVAIVWQLTEGSQHRQLEFRWVERGGPVTLPPARLGFGTTFLQTMLTDSAHPQLKFESQGFTYSTHLPLEGAMAEAA